MSEIEKRARELWAEQYELQGDFAWARIIREGSDGLVAKVDSCAISAIVAALTPPDGFVLVPVEPTEEMKRRGTFHVSNPCGLATDVWAAMIAARPEKPDA